MAGCNINKYNGIHEKRTYTFTKHQKHQKAEINKSKNRFLHASVFLEKQT